MGLVSLWDIWIGYQHQKTIYRQAVCYAHPLKYDASFADQYKSRFAGSSFGLRSRIRVDRAYLERGKSRSIVA